MCQVAVPTHVPNVDARFFMSTCPCKPARPMVEVWRPGERKHATVVYGVAHVRKHLPGLWVAIRQRYRVWDLHAAAIGSVEVARLLA